PEDEAQAVVAQVLAWRAAGLRKIALVALDRAVSRRVWALLSRCGVLLRDDTGWLLSTSRSASSWQHGFALYAGEVTYELLTDWLRHPLLVLDGKAALLRDLKRLALSSDAVLRTWDDWLGMTRLAQAATAAWLRRAAAYRARLVAPRSLAQWVAVVEHFAADFGLLESWRNDAAGVVWLRLLDAWRVVADDSALSWATFLRVVQSEVEQATFRPHDVQNHAQTYDFNQKIIVKI
ncbi:MAG: hypothetical protein ACRCV6_05225, partial [Formosimonas sp.]